MGVAMLPEATLEVEASENVITKGQHLLVLTVNISSLEYLLDFGMHQLCSNG